MGGMLKTMEDTATVKTAREILESNGSAIRPLFILVAVAIAILFATVILVGFRGDSLAHETEVSQVNGMVKYREEKIASSLISLSNSPVTQELSHEGLRPADVQAHVVAPLQGIMRLGQIFLATEEGKLVFQSKPIEGSRPLSYAALSEIALNTWEQTAGNTQMVAIERFATDDDVYMLTVSRLARQADGQSVLLITVTSLTTLYSREFQEGLGLSQFAALTASERPKQGHAFPVRNASGAAIGWFTWRTWNPGQKVVLQFLPLLLVLALSIFASALLFWQKAQNLAHSIAESQRDAHHLALHDPLTGLANRTLLNQRINEAIDGLKRGHKGFAIHLIDLDRFKDVNDTLGHQAGDELIRLAATRLKDICRTTDTVARIGGDEFAIVQTDVSSPASAARLARRALEQLSAKFNIKGSEVFLSGSIGVAVEADTSATQTELVRQSDIALYRAKSSGRNRFCFFEPEMDRTIQEKRSIETDLRTALAEGNTQELSVVYQPQVSANGRHIRGLEALIRWKHPTRGLISPSEFIPIAEETGLVVQLGEYVMRQAFKAARQWPDITMAVNVSAAELHHQNYTARVIQIAQEHGLRPDQVELEITETVLLEDSVRVTRTLKALKAAGFRIALDDFGTGYSSLSYLRRHQVDKLKIDQSFVASIGVRDDAGAVVQAIIHLGEALGLTVTAEGVETIAQRDALRLQGCAYLQGYLFSRPQKANEITKLLKLFEERGAA